MNTNTEREELADFIYRSNYNDPNSPGIQPLPDRSDNERRRMYAAADAILAAGYRKPRTITTVEELDALPFYSVITDAYDTPYVCEKHRLDGTGNEWSAAGSSHLQDSWSVLEHGDVTVRHTPEPTK